MFYDEILLLRIQAWEEAFADYIEELDSADPWVVKALVDERLNRTARMGYEVGATVTHKLMSMPIEKEIDNADKGAG